MAYLYKNKNSIYYIIDKTVKPSWIRISPRGRFARKLSKPEALQCLYRYINNNTYLRLDLPLPPSKITLQKLVDEYLQSIKSYKKKQTIENEKNYLNYLCKQHNEIKKLFGEMQISAIKAEELEAYFFGKDYKPNTVRLILNALDHAYRYAIEKKYLKTNPVKSVRRPKIDEAIPKYLDFDIINKILEKMSGAARDYFTILTYTGLRSVEARLLKVEDIRGDFIVIPRSKTGKFRAVPIHNEIKPILNRLCKNKKPSAYLLLNRHGNPYDKTGFRKPLSEAIKKAKISEKVSPHRFRHSFATELLRKGVDIKTVQSLLGHSTVKTTEIYARVLPEMLIEKINVLSLPGNNSKGEHNNEKTDNSSNSSSYDELRRVVG